MLPTSSSWSWFFYAVSCSLPACCMKSTRSRQLHFPKLNLKRRDTEWYLMFYCHDNLGLCTFFPISYNLDAMRRKYWFWDAWDIFQPCNLKNDIAKITLFYSQHNLGGQLLTRMVGFFLIKKFKEAYFQQSSFGDARNSL